MSRKRHSQSPSVEPATEKVKLSSSTWENSERERLITQQICFSFLLTPVSEKGHLDLQTSVGLNSTLHPIDEFGGGGLKRNVCQLVDWIF